MDAQAWLKLTGVLAYMVALLAIGGVASRRIKDMRDYYAGGKKLGFWAAAFSARATGESAWLLLGLTGMGAAVGVHALWVVAGELIGVSLAWTAMCRRFKNLTDKYDSITMPDYLESRFRDGGHAIRLVSAVALVVFVTIYVSAQIDATGSAFESFLGWNYFVGAIVGFLVVLVYIESGGFLAVAWSDVFQGSLMVLGLVALPLLGLKHAGGLGPVLDGLRAIDPALVAPLGSQGATLEGICGTLALLCIGIGFLGSPQIFVRFLALRSPDEIRKGTWVAITWTLLADTGAVLTGMIGRHMFTGPGQDLVTELGNKGQNVLPVMSEALLPALMVGIFIAVVLAATMSTIDSLLVVASSAAARDYYQKIRRPDVSDEALLGIGRRVTLVLALVALAMAMAVGALAENRTIFWFVIFGWSGISATFCPTVILSLFWTRMTARGALAAMVVGFISVPIFKFVVPQLPHVGVYFGALEELAPAFLLSFLAGVLVSVVDSDGQDRMAGIKDELVEAARKCQA